MNVTEGSLEDLEECSVGSEGRFYVGCGRSSHC